MRAAVLHGRQDLRVEDVAVPAPGPGELLLETGTVGLCGTDAHEFHAGPSMFPVTTRHPVTGHEGPLVVGHEFSGTVVEVGEGVDRAWVGRPVASCGAVWCGDCAACRSGRTNLCATYSAVGLHRDGALADYVVTPVMNVSPVEERGLTPDGAALGQPMSIAVHARNRGRVRDGDRVALFGVGGIGAFLVHATAAAGGAVVAIDAAPERLTLAKGLGAAHTLPADEVTPGSVADLLGGPPDVVLEATGRADALAAAAASLPPGGRLVAVGIHGAPRELDLRRLTLSELEVIGTNAMVRGTDFEEALDLVAARTEGWADVAPIVLPVTETADVLSAIAAGRSPAVKVLVDPRTPGRRPADTTPRGDHS